MANLPYIPSANLPTLVVTKYEPSLALDGGADGLDLIRRLLAQIPDVIRPGGFVLLEIGAEQGEAVKHLAQTMLTPVDVAIHKDYAGHDRVVAIGL